MNSTVQVEVCVNGTITRASARAINRATGSSLSGSSTAAQAVVACHSAGVTVRYLAAASLSGADKGRHTREVTRSRKAQAARTERKASVALAMAS